MRLHRRPRSRWLGRLVRRHRPDRNPLRRRSDRAQTAVLGLLLAVFGAGAPLAAHAVGSQVYTMSVHEARDARTVAHQVPATLVQAEPALSLDGFGQVPQVSARWRTAGGQVRTGPVIAASGARAGTTVLVWVNRDGQLTSPPLEFAQVAGRVQLAEGLTAAALALVLIMVAWLACRHLDRRRMAAWDADWLTTGPRWSPRRR